MKKAIKDILKDNNLKVTEGRLSVIEFLMSNKGPLSIDELKDGLENIDTSTLYRMLDIFVEKGIVYQTDFRNGKAYFEYQKNHHHHIVCTSCGSKEEVSVCVGDKVEGIKKDSKKFDVVKSHILEFFGICKKCNVLKSLIIVLSLFIFSGVSNAQQLHEDYNKTLRGEVVEVVSEEYKEIPGTGTDYLYQVINVEILGGERKGEVVEIENDYLELKEGNKIYFNHYVYIDGGELYAVRNIDRMGSLILLVGIFLATIIIFGGWQGFRSILSLLGSFFAIFYILLPSLLKGWDPILTSFVVASGILFAAIFFTHGFNKESVVAYSGTMIAVLITSIFAIFAVGISHLSGFAAEEAVYLNFNTNGLLDFKALLLGAIMIGILGVLDDISVTQAAVVTELYNSNDNLSKKEVYNKAMRVGREHVGALVNTLVLAYTGASLSLFLYAYISDSSFITSINSEIFATEIVRAIVGSVGLILTVPIVTGLAVFFLKGYKSDKKCSHSHI